MITHNPDSLRRGARWLCVAAALCLPSISLLAADKEAVAKPYTLYSGANFSVEWRGQLYPIQGVERDAFVILVDGKRTPVRAADMRMKIDSAMKMTTAFATLDNVKAERAYTDAKDPSHYVREAMQNQSSASMSIDIAAANMNQAQSMYGMEHSSSQGAPLGAPPPTTTETDVTKAENDFSNSLNGGFDELNSVPDAMAKEQAERERELFDAFKLDFEVSSKVPLDDAYVILMVKIRENPKDAKTTRLMVYGRVLPTIDSRPEKIQIYRAGFPVGYQLESYQLHLYNHGTEIPTSGAANRMALTPDDAFQYYNVEYAIRNPGKTAPAAPAKSFWPAEALERLSSDTLDHAIFVKVDKNGRASGLFEDEACTVPVRNPALEAVRPELHFHPALTAGKPVEAVLAINLSKSVN